MTNANPRIKQLAEAIRVLEQETIPRIAMGVLSALRAREPELGGRINAASEELRGIPTRATEEMRLTRQVVASENLYNALKARYEEVSMAEAQTARTSAFSTWRHRRSFQIQTMPPGCCYWP